MCSDPYGQGARTKTRATPKGRQAGYVPHCAAQSPLIPLASSAVARSATELAAFEAARPGLVPAGCAAQN
jgi:hypothetical protein